MKMKGILSLDLGINMGWSRLSRKGHFDTGRENWGAKRGETNGPRFARFRAWLIVKVEEGEIGTVAYEQVLTRHRSGAQAALANGFVAILEEVAEEYGLELMTIHGSTLKKHATGSGTSDKADMILAAWDRWSSSRNLWVFVDQKTSAEHWPDYVRRGKVPSDDQVDAVWVLNWALGELGLAPESFFSPCEVCKHPASDHIVARVLQSYRCTRGGCRCSRPLSDGEMHEWAGADIKLDPDIFDGTDVPCAHCGDPVSRISVNCFWAHAPTEPEKWLFKHLSCLQPGTRSYKKGEKRQKKKVQQELFS